MEKSVLISCFSFFATLYSIIFTIFKTKSYKTELFNRFHSTEFWYIVWNTKRYKKKFNCMLYILPGVWFIITFIIIPILNLCHWRYQNLLDIAFIIIFFIVALPITCHILNSYKRKISDVQTADAIEMAKSTAIIGDIKRKFPHLTTNDDLIFDIMRVFDCVIKKESPWGPDQKIIFQKERDALIERLNHLKSSNNEEDKEVTKRIQILSKLFDDKYFV